MDKKWGLTMDEIERLINHIAASYGVNSDDCKGAFTYWHFSEARSMEDLVAEIDANVRTAKKRVASAPAVIAGNKTKTSRHIETWRAGGQEASVVPGTSREVIREWFASQGIHEEPDLGMYERDEPFTFAGHGDWRD